MKKLSAVIKLSGTVGIAVGAYLSKELLTWSVAKGWKTSFVILLVVATTVFLSKACERFVGECIDRFSFLRRWIEWGTYIEGYWFDCYQHTGSEYGLIQITFENGKVLIQGETISDAGAPLFSWESTLSDFRDNTLSYLYRARDQRGDTPYNEVFGYLSITFSGDKLRGQPTRFSGLLFDFSDEPKKEALKGIRISAKEFARAKKDPSLVTTLRERVGARGA